MTESKPRFDQVVPVFHVRDLQASLAFYRDRLGLQLAWTWEEPPIASLCAEGFQVMLKQVPADEVHAAEIYVEMSGIDAFHDALVAAGCPLSVPLRDRPYRMRDLRIDDPDGNQLSFGEPLR